jgi:hypothetical protein
VPRFVRSLEPDQLATLLLALAADLPAVAQILGELARSAVTPAGSDPGSGSTFS